MWFSQKKQYSLVFEFYAESMEDFDRMVICEQKITKVVRKGEVDGHDVGGGVFNIFVVTKEPIECFKEVMPQLASMTMVPNAVGYRAVDEDDYTRLWPENDRSPFELH
jgi:hypothetical protein